MSWRGSQQYRRIQMDASRVARRLHGAAVSNLASQGNPRAKKFAMIQSNDAVYTLDGQV